MQYQTRHLEANVEISHGDKLVRPGDRFEATEVDAEHYLRRGQAKVITNTPAPAAAPAPAAPRAAKTPAPRAATAAKTSTTRAHSATHAPAAATTSTVAADSAAAGETNPTAWERTEPIAGAAEPDAAAPPKPEA